MEVNISISINADTCGSKCPFLSYKDGPTCHFPFRDPPVSIKLDCDVNDTFRCQECLNTWRVKNCHVCGNTVVNPSQLGIAYVNPTGMENITKYLRHESLWLCSKCYQSILDRLKCERNR